MKAALLIFFAWTVAACGGSSKETVRRYTLQRAEIGLSQAGDKQVATIVLHCDDHTRYFTSLDSSKPAEIVERFRSVLPIAASFRSHGCSSCQLEISFEQWHWQTVADQRQPPQKQAWFRFTPRTELSQAFSVQDYAEGVPADFTASFSQDLSIPVVFRERHYVETQWHNPP